MAFIKSSENKEIKLVLTNWGKRRFLEDGLLGQLKYFALIDTDINYTVDVVPNKFPDFNGSQDNGTSYYDRCKYRIY